MTENKPQVLDYSQTTRRSRGVLQRIFYCISLPLIVFGFIVAMSPGDRLVGAVIAAVGALLLGFALPVERS